MRKPFIALLIIVVVFFGLDRLAAHLYLPKENASEIVMYSASWCPYCKALRNTLNQYNIPFTEHDVEKSIQGFIGFWALRGHAVPVTVIGEQVIHGYDGQIITDALISNGYEISAEWPSHEQE